MAYKIIDIQGIGEAYAPKLIAIGIKTPEELLEAGLTPSARKKVAEETGISGKLILKWANHADLRMSFPENRKPLHPRRRVR